MLINILLASLLAYLSNQEAKPVQPNRESLAQGELAVPFKCSQPAAERDALISKAEAEEYVVRLIYFYGLEHTRDQVVRRRLTLIEGDSFTRKNLVKSLENMSKLKSIRPVGLDDVVIELIDKGEKRVNTSICFKERRR